MQIYLNVIGNQTADTVVIWITMLIVFGSLLLPFQLAQVTIFQVLYCSLFVLYLYVCVIC